MIASNIYLYNSLGCVDLESVVFVAANKAVPGSVGDSQMFFFRKMIHAMYCSQSAIEVRTNCEQL